MEYGRLVVLGYSSYRVAMTKPAPRHGGQDLDATACRSPVGAIGTPEMRKSEKDRRVIGQMWEPIGDQNAQYTLARRTSGNGVKLRRFHHFYARTLRTDGGSPGSIVVPSKADLKSATRRMLHAVDAHSSRAETTRAAEPPPQAQAPPFLLCLPMNDADAHASVMEYTCDAATDMFQIGRMPCKQNDVVVPGPRVGASGTISRFAARILCRRDAPAECRIYAGGFDATRRMTAAGHALKRCASCGEWLKRLPADHACVLRMLSDNQQRHGHDGTEFHHVATEISSAEQLPIDGLTKNGVRVWLPEQRQWFEVSVNGNLYAIASRTASPAKKASATPDTSVRHSAFNRPTDGVATDIPALLTNGAIIDLGGVQLQFHSPWSNQSEDATDEESDNLLRASMSMLGADAAAQLDQLNVQCPVQLHPLRFRDAVDPDQVPYVFPACGHVFGFEKRIARAKTCPLCRHAGHFVPLLLKESGQLVARNRITNAIPECVFNPCGHAISQRLASHYAALLMPNGRAICPFCAVHLDATTPFARLYLFSDQAA